MAFDYINEAFKRLKMLDEDVFDTSVTGINALSNYIDDADEETVRVIDSEASTEEDLKDSYVGKVIINCNVCHSHIFEDKENIKIEEDGSVNVEEQCPYCGESEGFAVIGEIAPFGAESEVEEAPVDEPTEEAETEEVDENLTEAVKVVGNKPMGTDYRPTFEKIAQVVDGKFDFIDDLVVDVDRVIMVINRDINKDELSKVLDVMNNTQECKENKWHAVYSGMKDDKNVIIQFEYGSGMDLEVSPIEENVEASLRRDSDAENIPLSRATRRRMQEDFKEVSIKTDDQHLEMTSDENGKVTVVTEPITNEQPVAEETIVPVSDETTDEIVSNNAEVIEEEEPVEEQPAEEDEFDFDFDEIDEEGFDELSESYLREVYDNVKSYRTTSIGANNNSIVVEGLIKFNSGAEKKTGFIFEACDVNSRGQLRFKGYNKHFTESKEAYSLIGRVDNKKLFVESFKYNYNVNNEAVRGRVTRK